MARSLLLCLVTVLLALSHLSTTAATIRYDPTTPLILDLYLANTSSQADGRAAALVTSFPPVYSGDDSINPITFPFIQHSGYFAVTSTCNMFFQLFHSTSSSAARPLILFLAGGPGLSATFWTLLGSGPLSFQLSPSRLVYQNASWAEDADLLLVDSPVGVGWSQCSDSSYATNFTVVSQHLTIFMHKFLTLFPVLQLSPLYVAGHSFGGRFAPDAAVAFVADDIPVAGLIAESPITHPLWSVSEACTVLYQQGLLSRPGWSECARQLVALRDAVATGNETAASVAIGTVQRMFSRQSGIADGGDFDRVVRYGGDRLGAQYLLYTSTAMRLALHTGNTTSTNILVNYAGIFPDTWISQSLTALDALLASSDATRVLYYSSNRETLDGASMQQLLNQTQYAQSTGWMTGTIAEPLTVPEQSGTATRGLLKRDTRLWCAVTLGAGHWQSVTMPQLTRSLVRSFVEPTALPAAATITATTPTSTTSQADKLLPPSMRRKASAPRSAASAADPVVSPAVYLTPFLQQPNGAVLAQQASAVTLPQQTVLAANTTYAGYITVDAQYNSNTFFWFIPSLDGNPAAPLIVHLSGGPGISSLAMGALYQHGPFVVLDAASLTIARRNNSYAEHYHMLYVDNPIGTGYSYTMESRGLRNDSQQIASDLYEFMRQFYQLFPSYRTSRLYIHGVSYAGHFLPTLGARIHRENIRRSAAEYMPFEGILVASGWMDLPSQRRDEAAFFVGIGRSELQRPHHIIGPSDLDWYNYMYGDVWEQQEAGIMSYLTSAAVVSALHAGPGGLHISSYNASVSRALRSDPSVKPEVELLLSTGAYQVLLFTAEFDVVCAASGVMNFIASLNYTQQTGWLSSAVPMVQVQPAVPSWQSRQPPWTTPLQMYTPQPQEVIWYRAGSASTLTYALIRFAGHLIEQTHLFQARAILDTIIARPTLPKPPSTFSPSSSSSSASTVSTSSPLSSSALPAVGSSSSAVSPSLSSSTGSDDPPADGGGSEPFIKSGAGISLMILLLFAAIVGVSAFVQYRRDSWLKRGGAGAAASPLNDSLLGDGSHGIGDVYSRL